jgi:8-oxo-dGTP diphosphatase
LSKKPILTVDIIIRKDGKYVFIRRKNQPFKDYWALPGGIVECGETIEQAALREAEEETGLKVELIELVGVYSDPKRDPRGHYVSIAFLANAVKGKLQASSDVEEIKLFTKAPKPLAFDHNKIFRDAIKLVKQS